MTKIAINSLGVDGGGGKTYVEHFLPALEQLSSDFQFFVLIRHSFLPKAPKTGSRITYVPVKLASGNYHRFVREQIWIPQWLKNNKIDLLFSPADSTAVFSPCPVVLAMRNLNLYVKRDKGWSLPFQIKFQALSFFAKLSSSVAKRIIFVSNTSKKIISERLKIPNEKQRVVYHGLSPLFFERSAKKPEAFSWLNENTSYILSVSSVYRYKNFIRLIEAFAETRAGFGNDCRLLIAGKAYDKPYYRQMVETIKERRLESKVRLIGEVRYDDLPYLYQHAKLFVFPSYLETFGHPLVEAMASGVPIVAADIDNSREITGNSALFFSPFDTAELSKQLLAGMENEEMRRRSVEKGLSRVKNFSWKRCAEETLSIFKEAVA